jgi:1-acyl-sn-glycerol-3-phosphate acyltransferase
VHRTMFDTPILNVLLRRLALFLMWLFGWRIEGKLPDTPKFVLIAAPHTSNWDLPVMLSLAFAFRTGLFWMGKDTLFRRPFGAIMRWLGGIPIDRSKSHNVVEQSAEHFRKAESLVMVVPPEGTRQKVRYWKTGFYRIAESAGVPIALGFLDYRRKVGGFGPTVVPTGDIEADMETIQAFYANITGKHSDQFDQADVTPSGQ